MSVSADVDQSLHHLVKMAKAKQGQQLGSTRLALRFHAWTVALALILNERLGKLTVELFSHPFHLTASRDRGRRLDNAGYLLIDHQPEMYLHRNASALMSARVFSKPSHLLDTSSSSTSLWAELA